MDWTPLEDEYESYCRQLEEAAIEGELQDPEIAREVGFPKKLHLSDVEKDQFMEFVGLRTQEAFEMFQQMGGINPAVVSQTIMNVGLAAMMWEYERVGR